MFKGTRRDDRPGLEPLETEDFVFELLDAILLGANDLKQLPHQGSIFCFRNLGQSQSRGPILPAAMPFVPIFLRSYVFSASGISGRVNRMALFYQLPCHSSRYF